MRKEVIRIVLPQRPAYRIIRLNYERLTAIDRDDAHGAPCIYCWEPMTSPSWDHVVPVSKGGPNTRGNLVVSCRHCNGLKDDLSLLEFEGTLLGVGSSIASRVSAFRQWLTEDWSEEDKQLAQRCIAQCWAEAKRAKTQAKIGIPVGIIKPALSRLVRQQLRNENAEAMSERRPYTLKDLRR